MKSAQEISDKILLQYEQVRQSGKCNMLDANCVQIAANAMELYDLVVYIGEGKEVRERYAKLLVAYDPKRIKKLQETIWK